MLIAAAQKCSAGGEEVQAGTRRTEALVAVASWQDRSKELVLVLLDVMRAVWRVPGFPE